MSNKIITVRNLSIQFEVDNAEDKETATKEAIELINLSLQREPYGLGAQVLGVAHLDDIEVQDGEPDFGGDGFSIEDR